MYAALKLKDAYSLKGKLWPRAWWAAVHGVTRSQTRLSNFTFSFHLHALEKEMAIHSGVLAWRIPGTGEPGGLPSMGSHRVGQDWLDLAAAAAAVMTISCLHMNMQVLDFQRCEHVFCQHQTGVKWQLALHLLSLLILQFYRLPPPLPSPVSNPSFLVTWHQPLYAPFVLYGDSQSTVL